MDSDEKGLLGDSLSTSASPLVMTRTNLWESLAIPPFKASCAPPQSVVTDVFSLSRVGYGCLDMLVDCGDACL